MKHQRFATAFLLVAAVPGFCQTEAQMPTAVPDPAAQIETSGPTMNQSSSRPEPAAPVSNVERDEMQVHHPPTSDLDDQMLVPPSVSTAGVSLEFASETPRSNYVSGGLSFMSTYNDNIGGGFQGGRISDVGYSFMPTFAWHQSSSRVVWNLNYAPGVSLYHHHSELNQYTQNVSLDSQFRLSPHVTLSLRDAFAKTSDPFNQLMPVVSASETAPEPITTIISPLSDQITNSGSAQLTYQFGLNSMMGATGFFTDLHYLNPSQVQGLSNSHSKGAEGFYSHRISGRHYVGGKYQFQSLLAALPTSSDSHTETHGLNLFYTMYLQPTASLSFYAGPQYSMTSGGGVPSTRAWSPMYGGSFDWQGQRMSFAISGGRAVSAGGGLQGAVSNENATASVRGQLTRSWSAGLSAFYAINSLLTPQVSSTNGHSIAGTVSIHRYMGHSLGLDLGYTHLHQTYSDLTALGVPVLPNINRVSLSLSYQFIRPIGR
jgi:hypothetical protein